MKTQEVFSSCASPSVFVCITLLVVLLYDRDTTELAWIKPNWILSNPVSSTLFAFNLFLTDVWIWSVFITVFIGAIIKAFVSSDGKYLHRFRFVLLDLLVAVIALKIPVLYSTAEFNMRLKQRMDIVKMVESGSLEKGRSWSQGYCELPTNLSYLSKLGEIRVSDYTNSAGLMDPQTIHVTFHTYRSFELEYAADDRPPQHGDKSEILHLRKNWYLIPSTGIPDL